MINLRAIFCIHHWEYLDSIPKTNGNSLVLYRCVKCNKERVSEMPYKSEVLKRYFSKEE